MWYSVNISRALCWLYLALHFNLWVLGRQQDNIADTLEWVDCLDTLYQYIYSVYRQYEPLNVAIA